MLCFFLKRLIQGYLGGALAERDAERLRHHTERCARCARALREAQTMARWVADLPRSILPIDEVEALLKQVRARGQERLGERLLGTAPAFPHPRRSLAMRLQEAWDALKHATLLLGFRLFSQRAVLPACATVPVAAALLLLLHQGLPRPGKMTGTLPKQERAPTNWQSQLRSDSDKSKGIQVMPSPRHGDKGSSSSTPRAIRPAVPKRPPHAGTHSATASRPNQAKRITLPTPSPPAVPSLSPAPSRLKRKEPPSVPKQPATVAAEVDSAQAEAAREGPRGLPLAPPEVPTAPLAPSEPPVERAEGALAGPPRSPAPSEPSPMVLRDREQASAVAPPAMQSHKEQGGPLGAAPPSALMPERRAQTTQRALPGQIDESKTQVQAEALGETARAGGGQAMGTPPYAVQGATSRSASASPSNQELAAAAKPAPLQQSAQASALVSARTVFLLRLLEGTPEESRLAALELGRRKEKRAVAALARILREHSDASVREAAAEALASIGTPEAWTALRKTAASNGPGSNAAQKVLERSVR